MGREQGTLMIVALGMEACWLFAAAAATSLAAGQDGPTLGLFGVTGLLAAAFGTAWVLERVDLPFWLLRLIGAVLGAMLVTGVVQGHVLGPQGVAPWSVLWIVPWTDSTLTSRQLAAGTVTMAAGLVIWWRGIRLAQWDPGFDPVVWSFRIGLVIVCAEALLEGLYAPARPAAWVALPFFSLGLAALSLAHFAEVGQQAFSIAVRRWVWLPPAVIAGLTVISLTLGYGLYSWVWAGLRWIVSFVERGVWYVFMAIFLAIGYLAEMLINGLRALIRAIGFQGSEVALVDFSGLLQEFQNQPNSDSMILRIISYFMIGLVIAVIGGAVLLWLANAFQQRLRNRQRQEEDDRESLWADGVLSDELQDMASRLLGRFRRGRSGLSLEGLGDDPRGILLRIYFQVLLLAARRGAERPVWQTPVEYRETLLRTFPNVPGAIRRITDGFIAARYSPSPPAPELAAAAQEDWEAVNRPESAAATS